MIPQDLAKLLSAKSASGSLVDRQVSGALLTPQRENVMVVEMVSIAEVVVGARRASDGALLCISGCKNTALTSTFRGDRA